MEQNTVVVDRHRFDAIRFRLSIFDTDLDPDPDPDPTPSFTHVRRKKLFTFIHSMPD
jgi:hypothetical protein